MSGEFDGVEASDAWKLAIEERRRRADYYFDEVLAGQQGWLSAKAGRNKQRHYSFALSIIVLGAAVTLLQVLVGAPWLPVATAVLGALVTVIQGADTLLRPGETWQGYRKASERMKQEYRLYVSKADAYGEAVDEDSAYRLLVARVEAVIAEEQQLFWRSREPKAPPLQSAAEQPPASEPTPGAAE